MTHSYEPLASAPLPSPMSAPLNSPMRAPLAEGDDALEMADSFASTGRASVSLAGSHRGAPPGLKERLGLGGVARRTMGVSLLLVTVFLWTTSNFLASSIFSDGSYNKPFFVVYANSSIFAMATIPMFIKFTIQNGISGVRYAVVQAWREQRYGITPLRSPEHGGNGLGIMSSNERLLLHPSPDDDDGHGHDHEIHTGATSGRSTPDPDAVLRRHAAMSAADAAADHEGRLTLGETARLSLEFSMLWFLANYLSSACLEYTSVASATILTSTSSVWTLVACAIMGVEGFSVRKLAGVAASLTGVVLISTVDLTGRNDENRGSFPDKTLAETAVGDVMALTSAAVYGIYVTVMKRRVGNEDRVNLPLFMGLVGWISLCILWPMFAILHLTNIEPFEMPPSGNIWGIVIANSLSSYFSDMSWAYAMLLTTPLVVTVGLSLTIPLSLIGEMIQYAQYSSFVYWIGAAVVFMSFVFINHESHDAGAADNKQAEEEEEEL